MLCYDLSEKYLWGHWAIKLAALNSNISRSWESADGVYGTVRCSICSVPQRIL